MNHRDKYRLEKTVPGKGHFKWSLTYAHLSPEEYIKENINKIVETEEGLTLQRVIGIGKECVGFVSEKDAYVSPNYDVDYIVAN